MDEQVCEARRQAYGWFRNSNPERTHHEAWSFALANWQQFRAEGGRHQPEECEPIAIIPRD